jgi:DNA-binding NtrC family response regulator
MSKQRIPITELARLLNAAQPPIYVLDEDLTIVFVNRAALDWLGIEESLVGLRCAYHSSAAAVGLDAVAAGLCPPPQVLAGQTIAATVGGTTADGRLIERRARFIPLAAEGDRPFAVLAIADLVDQPPATNVGDGREEQGALADDAGSIALHAQIRRFRQEAAVRYRADRLIGQGPAMALARRQVELAAASQSSVLLVGPLGSGRQHLAAAIHYGAEAGTFMPLDCSLLGAELLEAVLAAMTKEKLLVLDEAASKLGPASSSPGTLLFHRIDELSSDVQLELASLLVRRTPSWRLMATAAEPLVDLARRGKFREDLAAALSTLTIELPPLRQRRDDVPLLAQLFLEDLNAASPRQIAGFTPAALDLLDAQPWPGNLDELAQAVAEAHQRAGGREIDATDLPERLRLTRQAAGQPRRTEETIVLDEYLARVERELIRRALARAKGNKARAARLLGLTRPRLYRRMVLLGLESES